MSDVPWRWFVALDGPDLNGLIGSAGLMRFEWPSQQLEHRFYDGISGGHNVSIAPGGDILLLGNFSQQFAVVDTHTMEILQRVTTMGVEENDYRLRANTHHLWLDDTSFIGAVGEHLYEFHLDDLRIATKLGPHKLDNAHELRWTQDRRFIFMGDMGPEDAAARRVGIFDRNNPQATRVIKLPGTVWHTCVHPTRNIGYAVTYTVATEDDDYVDWGPAYAREYVVEIDLELAKVTRVWSSGAEFPVHLNSDLEIYAGDKPKLYIASGGSHTVVELDLDDFSTTRVVTVTPGQWARFWNFRQRGRNFLGALLRKSFYEATHFLLQTGFVTGWRWFDGVYCTRVSPDGRYVIAGNRGYNYIRVMDRDSLECVYETQLPRLDGGLHLGLHHSEIAPGAVLNPKA